LYIVSPWPNSVRESVESLSICKSASALANYCKKLEFRKIVVCSVSHFPVEMASDRTTGPRLAYLFRPADLLIHGDKIERITHIQLLIHQQDIIEGHLKRVIPILKGKTVIPLLYEHRSLFTKMGIAHEDSVIPIPIEPLPSEINLKTLRDILASSAKPGIVLMSNCSVRKNFYEGFLAVIDAIKMYNSEVNLSVISHTGGTASIRKVLDYFPVPGLSFQLYDNPSRKDLYTIVGQSTTLVLPSFDEGYNLVIREMGRLGIDIVCANIPVNSSFKREGRINLFEVSKQEIVGSDKDEISQVVEFEVPVYSDMVSKIAESISRWQDTKNYMLSRLESHATVSYVIPGFIENLSRVYRVPMRRDSSETVVHII
jgi:hypothetical protein